MATDRSPSVLFETRAGPTMQSHRAPYILCLSLLLVVGGCSTEPFDEGPVEIVAAPQVPTSHPALPPLPSQASEDRTSNIMRDEFVDEHLEEMAAFDVLVLSLHAVYTDAGAANIARIRRLNPDIVVLGLHQVLARHQSWDDPEFRQLFPFAAEQGDLWAPHLLRQLNGEPAMMWSESQMVDPTDGGTDISRELLVRHVNLFAKYAQRYPDAIDGLFHDYMSSAPWLYPDGAIAGTGVDVDLDGDGVGVQEDPGDEEIWRHWQRELLRECQSRFGPGLIQVANGNLGIVDEQAGRLMAGIVYQHFPRTVWGYTDQQGLELAIDHAENRLTPRRGRVWSLLESETLVRPGDVEFRRVASMLTGLSYIHRSSKWDEFFGRDDLGIDYGDPLGPARKVVGPGGGVRFERAFENGTAAIDFDLNGSASAMEPFTE